MSADVRRPSLESFALRDEPPSTPAGSPPPVGRYRTPLRSAEVEALGAPRFRLKEWHYQSFTSPDWFLAFAVVHVGYAAQLFVYLVDRHTRRCVQLERISPLGRALRFAQSSVVGVSSFRSRGVALDVGFDDGAFARLDLPLGDARLVGELRCEYDEALALVFPLATKRLAYTHKAAGMRASGSLRWGARQLAFDGALAALDFTRSIAKRHTVWNWASFSGYTESGKRLGLNLSARVYDLDGRSMENALWLDGRVRALGPVRFSVPARTTDAWRIDSVDGASEVALDVRPWGERRAALDIVLMRSVFVQPYGEASGTLCGERVSGAFGVVEDHDALW